MHAAVHREYDRKLSEALYLSLKTAAMARLLLLQLFLLSFLVIDNKSQAVKNEQKFKTFIHDVMWKFQSWPKMHGNRKEQFAVMMFVDDVTDWKFSFDPPLFNQRKRIQLTMLQLYQPKQRWTVTFNYQKWWKTNEEALSSGFWEMCFHRVFH